MILKINKLASKTCLFHQFEDGLICFRHFSFQSLFNNLDDHVKIGGKYSTFVS